MKISIKEKRKTGFYQSINRKLAEIFDIVGVIPIIFQKT
jgi:hypothetical protein